MSLSPGARRDRLLPRVNESRGRSSDLDDQLGVRVVRLGPVQRGVTRTQHQRTALRVAGQL